MNCKQGDLAVIVHSLLGQSVGKIVRCVRFAGPMLFTRGVGIRDTWETDRVNVTTTYPHNLVPDDWLRPIRDSDGEDETLQWAGKPTETPADIIKEVSTCS